MPKVLGLIAGDGVFPQAIACGATQKGCRVHAVGFYGLTRPELSQYVSEFNWHHLGQIDAVLEDLRRAGVDSLVLAGKIDKTNLTRPGEGGLQDGAGADRRGGRG